MTSLGLSIVQPAMGSALSCNIGSVIQPAIDSEVFTFKVMSRTSIPDTISISFASRSKSYRYVESLSSTHTHAEQNAC